jgi:hypothetical protein
MVNWHLWNHEPSQQFLPSCCSQAFCHTNPKGANT